ncbi:MAG: synthase [Patescibacteria group bacterium]|nr:synthase [Patescibacteria group bacterium]
MTTISTPKKDKKSDCKYIFVVGGVISGVGKGVAASSIARILQDRGRNVTAIKIDPYINIDAGTMNPTEHGEVFVLSDGDECDQDMGNYERFLDVNLTRINYMTTGRVYQSVINRERNLEYAGKCVEVVPHIPLEVIRRIEEARDKAQADVVVIEIGGTVGEYQNMLFLEAARMMKLRDSKSVFVVMVSYLPVPSKVGEMKTKPTQYAVRTLNASGIQPDVIIARSQVGLDDKRKEKLSMFCNVPVDRVISAPDVDSIYDIPINFEKEGLGDMICDVVDMKCESSDNVGSKKWKKFANKVHTSKKEVHIAVVGKYFDTGDFVLSDSYLSVIEAIKYSAYDNSVKPILTWINSIDFEKDKNNLKKLSKFDGILVPGGFGSRGVEGIISVVEYARRNKIPYFGLCYGMQLLVIEYARNVLGLKDANTLEVNPKSKNLVINVMDSQIENLSKNKMGGTMRLGDYKAILKKGSVARLAYGTNDVIERHRHRYEVNNDYIDRLEDKGLVFSGTSPDGKLMEIAELPKDQHPFFLGTQFHPEFLARPLAPHKLFSAFIKACKK